MENAKDMNLRDMLDEVGLVLRRYESENGTKQSFSYEVIFIVFIARYIFLNFEG